MPLVPFILQRQRQLRMYQPRNPVPTLGRMMVFVDGENPIARYQGMVDAGRKPLDCVCYRKDIYVWSFPSVQPGLNVISRATYYTYAVGSGDLVDEVATELQAQRFNCWRALPSAACTDAILQSVL